MARGCISLSACVLLLALVASVAHANVTNFVLVDVRTLKHMGYVFDRQTMSRAAYLSLKAEVNNVGATKSVIFYVNGKKTATVTQAPYYVSGTNPKSGRPRWWGGKPRGLVTVRAVQHTKDGKTYARNVVINVRANVATTATADPTCKAGIAAGRVCCPKSCGKCTGSDCGKRPGGLNCCGGYITKNKPFCDKAGAPCRLRKPVTNPTAPKPAATTGGAWRTVATNGEPNRRHEACFVYADGKGWLIGGRRINPTNMYDPVTQKWSKRKATPIEIHHMQCVSTPDGKIWIVAAFTGKFPFEKNVDKVYVYDTRKDLWSTRPGMPEKRRRGGAAVVRVGSWIYVLGGNRGGHGAHSTAYGWLDRYNWQSNKWETNLPTAPDARDHVGGGLVKGMVCMAAGRDSGIKKFSDNVVLPTNCYNMQTKTWVRKAPIPQGRAGAATATDCQGRLVVAGGEGFGRAFARVDYFDGTKWLAPSSLKRARHGSGLAVHSCGCGQITIASGSGNQGGGPELTSTETFYPGGEVKKCA